MGETWRRNPYAVEVADSLSSESGEAALSIALERRHLATVAGRIGRADLYQAVCTILADRDSVFTRWREGKVPPRKR